MGINKLSDVHNQAYSQAKHEVLVYVANHYDKYPVYYGNLVSGPDVEFAMRKNGIELWFKYTPSPAGAMFDEPTPEIQIYHLTYEEVFGWELPTRPTDKEVFDTLADTIEQLRPRPKPLDFQI